MQTETEAVNRDAIALLDPAPGDNVLDVGTGNGMSLRHLAARVGSGRVVGIDHSPVMCRRAASNNKSLIARGKVAIEQARSNQLPFDSGCFDAAMGVHTLYFWDPAEPHLREVARVLRPGGKFVLAFRTDSDPAAAEFPASVYTFRSKDAVARLVDACGFRINRFVNGTGSETLLCASRSSY